VRLIVDREREIQNFKPEEYWKITALLAPQGLVPPTAIAKLKTAIKPKLAHKPEAQARDAQSEDGQAEAAPPPQLPDGAFAAELAEWAGKKFSASKEAEAMAIVKALEGATYTVSKVEQKDQSERPSPPFTTSTLQQQASIRLHYTAKRTMMTAQR